MAQQAVVAMRCCLDEWPKTTEEENGSQCVALRVSWLADACSCFLPGLEALISTFFRFESSLARVG